MLHFSQFACFEKNVAYETAGVPYGKYCACDCFYAG
jgi:hypothetical protein